MARKRYLPLKGMQEHLPIDRDQGAALSWTAANIHHSFEKLAGSYGYLPISLPLAEHHDVYEALGLEGGPGFSKEGVLRPAFQPGLCRTAVEQGLVRSHSGLRFYQTGQVFPHREESAETYLGIDILKEDAPTIDLEIIAFFRQFLASIGLDDVVICVNCIGDEESKVDFLEELELGTSSPGDVVDFESLDLYDEVRDGLEVLGIAYEENETQCGLFTWLNKIVFTLEIDGVIVGGGGHYGHLIEKLGGPPTEAVGGWVSLERLIDILEKREKLTSGKSGPDVLVAYMDSGVRFDALKLATDLRHAGVKTHFVYAAKNIGRQFKVASEMNIPTIVVVGGKEWDNGQVAIKHYGQEEQKFVPAAEVQKELSEFVSNQ